MGIFTILLLFAQLPNVCFGNEITFGVGSTLYWVRRWRSNENEVFFFLIWFACYSFRKIFGTTWSESFRLSWAVRRDRRMRNDSTTRTKDTKWNKSNWIHLLGHIQTTKKFRYVLIAALPWKTSSTYYALSVNFVINWAGNARGKRDKTGNFTLATLFLIFSRYFFLFGFLVRSNRF